MKIEIVWNERKKILYHEVAKNNLIYYLTRILVTVNYYHSKLLCDC